MAELVKNAIVNMDWEVENFFEHKADECFVAATQDYITNDGETITVIFMIGRAFILNDENGSPISHDDFVPLLKKITDKYGSDFLPDEIDETADGYVELSTGGSVDSDMAEYFGLDAEVCLDIVERLEDLSGYIQTDYTDM